MQHPRQTWSNQIIVVVSVLSWAAGIRASYGRQPFSPLSLQSPSSTQQLQDEKLRQEITKLQLENGKLASRSELFLSYTTWLTMLVAIGGLIATFWKQTNENNRQKELDRQQRERDRQQQERERLQRDEDSRRRLEEKLAASIKDLGSESQSIQASAAVSILTFLKPQYEEFHGQVYWTLLANLKVKPPKTLNSLLVSGFSIAIRTQCQTGRNDGRVVVDLSRCRLDRIDLAGLDLTNADLAFSNLASANMTGSNLFRVRGRETQLVRARLSRSNLGEARFRQASFNGAQFHESILVAADFRETDLRNAQFQQAKMQSAHLDRADLRGARFEEANLSDSFFFGAHLSLGTLRSILGAHNWEKAHFDEPIRRQLEGLAVEKAAP